jgi:hypothetical protein
VTELGDLGLILAGTQYEDSIPCIKATFEAAGIKTLNDLDNAPKKLTFCMCDYSTYPLLSFIRERVVNPPQAELAEPAPEEAQEEAEPLAQPEPEVQPDPQVNDDQETEAPPDGAEKE